MNSLSVGQNRLQNSKIWTCEEIYFQGSEELTLNRTGCITHIICDTALEDWCLSGDVISERPKVSVLTSVLTNGIQYVCTYIGWLSPFLEDLVYFLNLVWRKEEKNFF